MVFRLFLQGEDLAIFVHIFLIKQFFSVRACWIWDDYLRTQELFTY